MAEVKLFGAFSSAFSRRVELVLKQKGIEYEYIEEDLTNKSPLLLKYNPVHKKVPVFVHNGKAIAESLVIIEYIDETWKDNPILPADPYERARARFWAKFIDDKIVPALIKSVRSSGEEQQKAIEETHNALEILENELKDKKFFGGDNIGLADIAANVVAIWVGVMGEVKNIKFLTEEKYPNLCEWISDYLNCSIVKESQPDKETLLPIYQARVQPANASN